MNVELEKIKVTSTTNMFLTGLLLRKRRVIEMAQFNSEMVGALIAHTDDQSYPALKGLKEKLGLSLFSVISPSTFQRLENETASSPNIISEAISLMEICDTLSLFYQENTELTFSESIITQISNTRTRVHRAQMTSLHASAMAEYFTDDKFHAFLLANPVFVGLYIYVFLTSMTSL